MYRIVKDGAALALIEAPTYVRQAGNGCFVLCQEDQATGIAYGGTVYHLLGREAVEGAESVILEETDAGRRSSGRPPQTGSYSPPWRRPDPSTM